MVIVIDGYNLLKHIFPGLKNNLDKQKKSLIAQLAYYKASKGDGIKEIIVVFDAGPNNHATRSVKSGIVIVFSGLKNSADNWILDFVERNKNKEILVITLDRALREGCVKLGADWLDVHQFYNILQQKVLDDAKLSPRQEPEKTIIEKYEKVDLDESQNNQISPVALDLLMEQAAAQCNGQKASDYAEQSPRTKKSYTLSKKEKRLQKKLDKLK